MNYTAIDNLGNLRRGIPSSMTDEQILRMFPLCRFVDLYEGHRHVATITRSN